MASLFASRCGPPDLPPDNDKPTKQSQPAGKINQQRLRIVFYDFDRTIPTIHIYHETGGADDVSKKKRPIFC